jgi:ABC-2 type transport system ATP-binding protein
MIETHDLGKCFDQFWAVDGIDLQVAAGQVLGLLGPNGAGKTTTVRLLTSILKPSRGRAAVAGYDVVRYPEKVRASIGLLTEQHGLYGRMRSAEYLDFFGQLYAIDTNTRRQRVKTLLEMFGLEAVSKRRIGEYSKGMRQKLALARALLHDPPVLLLDEPTSAMDPESAHLVRDAIRELRSASRTIVICTHNLAEAEELSDQIAIIRQGRIIARGTPQALKLALLGPAEYEARFSQSLNGRLPTLPSTANLTSQGNDWIRYHSQKPEEDNPEILRLLLKQNLPVVTLQEVPRSLEQVYLQAVQIRQDEELNHG